MRGNWTRTELQHIDPHSIDYNSVSFPFSWAAQPEAWGPTLLGAGLLYCILIPTDWTSRAPSYIIVQHPHSSCGRHKSYSFNPSTVKVIFWYSSTGCTCYLHRCISYFDCPAGSEVNIQQVYSTIQTDWASSLISSLSGIQPLCLVQLRW